jgi:hypothetical protein
MIVNHNENILICNAAMMDADFVKTFPDSPEKNLEYDKLPEIFGSGGDKPNVIFSLSVILKKHDINDEGRLSPAGHFGQEFDNKVDAIIRTYNDVNSIGKFYVFDTALLQVNRYMLYVLAEKIWKLAIELSDISDDPAAISIDKISKEKILCARTKIFAAIGEDWSEIKKDAHDMALCTSKKWRDINKMGLEKLAKHFGKKYQLINWEDAVNIGEENIKGGFDKRKKFLKYFYETKDTFIAEQLNQKYGTEFKSKDTCKQKARGFQHCANTIVNTFYSGEDKKHEGIQWLTQFIGDDKLIKKQLREILFEESALRTLLPFDIEIYPGLPNITEEKVFEFYGIQNLMRPYAIGNYADIKKNAEMLCQRNPNKKSSVSEKKLVSNQEDLKARELEEKNNSENAVIERSKSIPIQTSSPERSLKPVIHPSSYPNVSFFTVKKPYNDLNIESKKRGNGCYKVTVVTIECDTKAQLIGALESVGFDASTTSNVLSQISPGSVNEEANRVSPRN